MNKVLIYCRPKNVESVAEQTAGILSEQFQQLGIQVDISHALNLPRLILNPYQTVHFIIENLPLSMNESVHLAVCKALGKSTIVSILNSEKKINRSFLEYVRPDAFSVSQTNHFKLYRNITCNKFIFSAFPKTSSAEKKCAFKRQAFLIPLQSRLEEAFDLNVASTVYFDGRKLLKHSGSSQLRKKWNELIENKKLQADYHLILSEQKLNSLLEHESLSVVLSDPVMTPTEFNEWLSKSMNKNNLIILNDFQATGFSNYWTSGRNCQVVTSQNWIRQLENVKTDETKNEFVVSSFKAAELFEPTVNELSRLYSKLWQQKTSLLTSGSVKL